LKFRQKSYKKNNLDEIFHYFIKKTVEIVNNHGFRVGAWEEAFIIGILRDQQKKII